MIKYISRDLLTDERRRILADYDQIMINAGIPLRGIKQYSLVVEEDGQLIGHASGLVDHRWLMLSDLWVDASHRQCGFGSRLLKTLEDMVRAEGVEHVYLWTYGPANTRFYAKNGYHEFAVFEDFYEIEGYHQIGFRKDLYDSDKA